MHDEMPGREMRLTGRLHDRPWQERPIFGMVRYRNESGLLRGFDIEGYVRRIESLGKERT